MIWFPLLYTFPFFFSPFRTLHAHPNFAIIPILSSQVSFPSILTVFNFYIHHTRPYREALHFIPPLEALYFCYIHRLIPTYFQISHSNWILYSIPWHALKNYIFKRVCHALLPNSFFLQDELDDESFENHRTGLIAEKLEKDPSLSYETGNYWSQITDKRYHLFVSLIYFYFTSSLVFGMCNACASKAYLTTWWHWMANIYCDLLFKFISVFIWNFMIFFYIYLCMWCTYCWLYIAVHWFFFLISKWIDYENCFSKTLGTRCAIKFSNMWFV